MKKAIFRYLPRVLLFIIFVTAIGFLGMLTLRLNILAVKDVVITGNQRVDQVEIVKRSGLRKGESTIFFFESKVRRNLLKNPWIKDVRVVKDYPSGVKIEIEEFVPYALMTTEQGELYYLSETGQRLGKGTMDEGLDYPLILIGDSMVNEALMSEALTLLQLSLVSHVLGWDQVSQLYLDSIYGITFYTTDRRRIEFSSGDIKEKWQRVEKIIKHAESMNLRESYIDISQLDMGVVDFNIAVLNQGVEDG